MIEEAPFTIEGYSQCNWAEDSGHGWARCLRFSYCSEFCSKHECFFDYLEDKRYYLEVDGLKLSNYPFGWPAETEYEQLGPPKRWISNFKYQFHDSPYRLEYWETWQND